MQPSLTAIQLFEVSDESTRPVRLMLLHICRRAPSGQGTGSMTRRLRKYDYAVQGKPLKFRIWDSMGWTNNDYRDGLLNYILDGQLPDRFDLSCGNPAGTRVRLTSWKT